MLSPLHPDRVDIVDIKFRISSIEIIKIIRKTIPENRPISSDVSTLCADGELYIFHIGPSENQGTRRPASASVINKIIELSTESSRRILGRRLLNWIWHRRAALRGHVRAIIFELFPFTL